MENHILDKKKKWFNEVILNLKEKNTTRALVQLLFKCLFLFQYACQSNLPNTVQLLVEDGKANVQIRNTTTGTYHNLIIN